MENATRIAALKQLEGMSVEQKLGQLFCISLGSTNVDADFLEAVRHYRFGNANLFGLNIQTLRQVRNMTENIQREMREGSGGIEALITVDEEGGSASQFSFGVTKMPGNFSLGAANDEHNTRLMGRILGNELSDAGFNMLLGPVLDLCRSPLNRIIGVRAFSDAPLRTAALGIAFAQGVEEGGCGCTYKHFPGHGAAVMKNALPINDLNEEALLKLDAYPFGKAIEAGASSIMVGHIALPGLSEDSSLLPASLSERVIHDLLREKMGFQGVVIADGAVAEQYPFAKASLMAFQAGTDIIVHNSIRHQIVAWKALMHALQKNRITEEELNEHVLRILELKAHVEECRRNRLVLNDLEKATVIRGTMQKSVTLLRDPMGLVPLGGRFNRALIVSPVLESLSVLDGNTKEFDTFGDHMALLFPHAEVRKIALTPTREEREALYELAKGADLVVIGSENANEFPCYLALVNDLVSIKPTVVVSLRFAYEAAFIDPRATVLGAFTFVNPAMEAVADVIAGRLEPRGDLPMRLPQSAAD